MSINLDILNNIKFFASPDFKSIPIYTRPYFKNVTINLLNSPQAPNYTLSYCDFNKLNSVNTNFSKDVGDVALYNSLEVIYNDLKSHLSDTNFDIYRVGGDEFIIITYNTDVNITKSILKEIYSKLHSDCIDTKDSSTPPKYLDFAYGIVDSSEFPNIDMIYYEAQKRESIYKLLYDKNGQNPNQILTSNINETFSKFFNNYRFSKYFEFLLPHAKDLALLSTQSAINLISDKNKLDLLSSGSKINYDFAFSHQLHQLSYKKCKALHDYVSGITEASSCLDTLSYEDLSKLFKTLIKNSVSEFLNQHYFYNCFIPKSKELGLSFKSAVLMDVTGIKDCNTKFDYSYTDTKLKHIANQLRQGFKEHLNLNFDNLLSSSSCNGNYIFDLGGGSYLSLFNRYIDPYLVQKINNDAMKNSFPLTTISSSRICQNEHLETTLDILTNDINEKKRNLRPDILSSDNIRDTLDLFLAPSIKYYCDNYEEPDSLQSQRKLMSIIANAVLKQSHISSEDFAKNNVNKDLERE